MGLMVKKQFEKFYDKFSKFYSKQPKKELVDQIAYAEAMRAMSVRRKK